MNVNEAMNHSCYEFDNMNVAVFAKADTLDEITLDSEAIIALEIDIEELDPECAYRIVWGLWEINMKQKEGLSNQVILDLVKSWRYYTSRLLVLIPKKFTDQYNASFDPEQ